MKTLTPTDRALFLLLLILTGALGWLFSYTLASTLASYPSMAVTVAMIWAGLLGWVACKFGGEASQPVAKTKPLLPPAHPPLLPHTRPLPPRHTITPLPDVLPLIVPEALLHHPPRPADMATQEVDLRDQLLAVTSLPCGPREELPTHPIEHAQLLPLLRGPHTQGEAHTQKIEESELLRHMTQSQTFEVGRESQTEELTVREVETVIPPHLSSRPGLETVPLLNLYDDEETPISECLDAVMDAMEWGGA